MKISIIPTSSEKFNLINQAWPELQFQTWSEVSILKSSYTAQHKRTLVYLVLGQ